MKALVATLRSLSASERAQLVAILKDVDDNLQSQPTGGTQYTAPETSKASLTADQTPDLMH